VGSVDFLTEIITEARISVSHAWQAPEVRHKLAQGVSPGSGGHKKGERRRRGTFARRSGGRDTPAISFSLQGCQQSQFGARVFLHFLRRNSQ